LTRNRLDCFQFVFVTVNSTLLPNPLEFRVRPNASRNKVGGTAGDPPRLVVAVQAPAVDGKARRIRGLAFRTSPACAAIFRQPRRGDRRVLAIRTDVRYDIHTQPERFHTSARASLPPSVVFRTFWTVQMNSSELREKGRKWQQIKPIRHLKNSR